MKFGSGNSKRIATGRMQLTGCCWRDAIALMCAWDGDHFCSSRECDVDEESWKYKGCMLAICFYLNDFFSIPKTRGRQDLPLRISHFSLFYRERLIAILTEHGDKGVHNNLGLGQVCGSHFNQDIFGVHGYFGMVSIDDNNTVGLCARALYSSNFGHLGDWWCHCTKLQSCFFRMFPGIEHLNWEVRW